MAKNKVDTQIVPQNVTGNDSPTVPLTAEGVQVIGKEQINEAAMTLQKYKDGKTNLEQRIVQNMQWYKLRHWEQMKGNQEDIQPASAWLFNCIANKHADAMDNYPRPNILPREEGDKNEAELLSSIIPVILEQNDFEGTYSNMWDDKLIGGTGVYGVFWDKDKLGGLGDVSIKDVDIINLFWESGIADIQKSRNLFYTELVDNDLLVSQYPQLNGRLTSASFEIAKYVYDDEVDTTNKSVVVDWYYRKKVGEKTLLHYVKFVNDEVLYATENDSSLKGRGLYDHGKYPFVFDPLFRTKGTPAGFGYIDVGKSAQEYIDRCDAAVLMNTLANTRPRYFVQKDGGINENEYADMTKPFVHVDGRVGEEVITPINGKPLSGIYVSVGQNKINELKETTGNRDVSTGGTSGATAASAIAAMQEAGSKLSRDALKASYRVFREVCVMVIELIRQFYDMPRCFRIVGENGAEKYEKYTNRNIVPQKQEAVFGVDMGYRLPLFDISVSAEKASPYSRLAQNELALSFYNASFFAPQNADSALACLDIMDFDGKDRVMTKIAENGTMYQQIIMLQKQLMSLGAVVDSMRGTNEVTGSLLQQFGAEAPTAPTGNVPQKENTQKESSVTAEARKRVATSTNPA